MTKTIIILHYDVTTVHGIVGFTDRFARDAEDTELDQILFFPFSKNQINKINLCVLCACGE